MFTAIVHVVALAVLAPTCVPLTTMLVPPAVAVMVPPVQVLTTPGVAATINPDGSVSVKLTDCAGLPGGGLLMVNVSTVVPPTLMVVGLKLLVNVGTSGVTVTQLGCTPFVTSFRPVTLAAALVKLAFGQVPTCPGALVMCT